MVLFGIFTASGLSGMALSALVLSGLGPLGAQEPIPKQERENVLRAETGAQGLAKTSSRSILLGRDWEENERVADAIEKQTDARFVRLEELPEELSEEAQFGTNLQIGGLGRSWIWDRVEGIDVVYLDLDADGFLTEDELFSFEEKNGKPFLRLAENLPDPLEEVEGFDLELEMTIDEINLPGSSAKRRAILLHSECWRTGMLELPDGSTMRFGLLGTGGIYNSRWNAVFFDTDGDEKLDVANRRSPERFDLSETLVELANTSFELKVERFGSWIELHPSSKSIDRHDLRVGATAPDFRAQTLKGDRLSLSDLRGKIVLLDFWGMGCAPCVAQIPTLKKAYEKFRDRGFEIVGLTADPASSLRPFLESKGAQWPQVLLGEDEEGIQKTYRIRGVPTYFLIDREGKIASDQVHANNLEAEVQRLLGEG